MLMLSNSQRNTLQACILLINCRSLLASSLFIRLLSCSSAALWMQFTNFHEKRDEISKLLFFFVRLKSFKDICQCETQRKKRQKRQKEEVDYYGICGSPHIIICHFKCVSQIFHRLSFHLCQ